MTDYENAFERFAEVETRGSSPLYETLSLANEVPEDQPSEWRDQSEKL